MDKFIIEGGFPLKGKLKVSGAKNAALPIMAACLLTEGKFCLENVPHLTDILSMSSVLERLGTKVTRENGILKIDSGELSYNEAPYDLAKLVRTSILVLGPLLARGREARVFLPGGCDIGKRPINLHLKGLEQLGAKIEVRDGYIKAYAKRNLCGNSIYLDVPSVGATQNLMFAAALAKGITLIKNASCTPETVDTAIFLKKMGAKVKGEGTKLIKVEGVKELHPVKHSIIPDRAEAGTLIMAAIITKGEVILDGIYPEHLEIILSKLRGMGADIEASNQRIRVKGAGILKPIKVKTFPYPGFSTDLQPQISALACLAQGTSLITETIWERRFTHVPGLRKMGAQIKEKERGIEIKGVSSLRGTSVAAPDIRAGAALILAGLAARGVTEVNEIYHVDRGYERLEEKLSSLGARIKRQL